MPIIPGPNNQMVTASLPTQYSSGTGNYSQTSITSPLNFTTGSGYLISGSLTTTGNPVFVVASGYFYPGCCSDISTGSLGLYRDGIQIGQKIKYSIVRTTPSDAINFPYHLSCVDIPSTGTHTYYVKVEEHTQALVFGSGSLIAFEIR